MDEQWRERAACKGMDTSLFFPSRGDNRAVKKAKQVCATCPVFDDCREYSLALSREFETMGIWAGMSQKGRDTHFGAKCRRRGYDDKDLP